VPPLRPPDGDARSIFDGQKSRRPVFARRIREGWTWRASPTGSGIGSGRLRSSGFVADTEAERMYRAAVAGGPGPRRPPVGGRHPEGFLVYRPRPVDLGGGWRRGGRGGLAPQGVYFRSYFNYLIYLLSSRRPRQPSQL